MTTPCGIVHNIAASHYTAPPITHTREDNLHAIYVRSPGDRAAGGRRLSFESPSGDDKVGSSAKHARSK